MNNFKTILKDVDVGPILNELNLHPELWNQHRFRTHSKLLEQCDDIILRYSVNSSDWLECESYPSMFILNAARQAVYALSFALKTDRVGRVMISRLPPGNKILPHRDNENIHNMCDYYNRYHLSLQDNPNTVFISGDESYRPAVGEVFWLDNSKVHSVENNGDTDRLTLIIDLKKPTMKAFYGPNESPTPVVDNKQEPKHLNVKESKILEGITYQREKIKDYRSELEPLLHHHYKEIALDQDVVPLDPDWDKYMFLEQALCYHMYTIRHEGKLVGYWGGNVGPHLHYKSTLHATTDLFWIDPSYRRCGIGDEFFDNIEELLKVYGVKKFITFFKDKDKQHLSVFFGHKGYNPSDIAVYKLL